MLKQSLLPILGLSLVSWSCRVQDGEGDRGSSQAGVGSRIYVVERETGSLAIYNYPERRLERARVEGLGDLRHAVMTFSPDLRFGFVATRSGLLTRIDLEKLARDADLQVSNNSIDIAIAQDGRILATAEYSPGGVTLVDTATFQVVKRHEATFEQGGMTLPSRVTGIVDAPGNRLVCVLIEGAEIWIIDASKPDFPIEHRIPTPTDLPYDAMITPDGRHYIVGHMASEIISVLDLDRPADGITRVSLRDPGQTAAPDVPVKIPHMASWAVASDFVFIPGVGEKRLVALDRRTWKIAKSVPLRGHPVYAVASPSGREIWVSFSGEEDDAFVQVVDTSTLEVTDTIRVGGRIYHLDFLPRGSFVLASANRDNEIVLIDARSHEIVDREPVPSPSGVFGPWRAYRIGL